MLLTFAPLFVLAGFAYWAFAPAETADAVVDTEEDAQWLSALQDLPSDGFERPSSTWRLDLPADHGAHAETRTETWQVTLHLRTSDGAPLDLQLSLMRLGIAPQIASASTSVWEIRDVYRGHVTVLDADGAAGEERFARALPGLVGATPEDGVLRLDDWSLSFEGTPEDLSIGITASLQNSARLDLELRPEKDVIAMEPDGTDVPFVGYTFTRLQVTGRVASSGDVSDVAGTAWLDHTWGELPLPGAGPVAWDRLQVQLENGTDLSALRARRTDGRGAATVNGFVVSQNGRVAGFDENAVTLEPTRFWRDAASGTRYPVAWRLSGSDFDLSIDPVADAQVHNFMFPFWGGAISVTGRWRDDDVTGSGHLQLTGYEE